jgi:hypothetical protein
MDAVVAPVECAGVLVVGPAKAALEPGTENATLLDDVAAAAVVEGRDDDASLIPDVVEDGTGCGTLDGSAFEAETVGVTCGAVVRIGVEDARDTVNPGVEGGALSDPGKAEVELAAEGPGDDVPDPDPDPSAMARFKRSATIGLDSQSGAVDEGVAPCVADVDVKGDTAGALAPAFVASPEDSAVDVCPDNADAWVPAFVAFLEDAVANICADIAVAAWTIRDVVSDASP